MGCGGLGSRRFPFHFSRFFFLSLFTFFTFHFSLFSFLFSLFSFLFSLHFSFLFSLSFLCICICTCTWGGAGHLFIFYYSDSDSVFICSNFVLSFFISFFFFSCLVWMGMARDTQRCDVLLLLFFSSVTACIKLFPFSLLSTIDGLTGMSKEEVMDDFMRFAARSQLYCRPATFRSA